MVASIGVDTAKNDLSKIHQKVDQAVGKKEESTHSVGSGCPEHLEGESAEVRKPGPAEGHWRQSSQNNCSRDFRDNH